jgi:hypothetical protein
MRVMLKLSKEEITKQENIIRKLMRENPSISRKELKSKTKFTMNIINQRYMKIRREYE